MASLIKSKYLLRFKSAPISCSMRVRYLSTSKTKSEETEEESFYSSEKTTHFGYETISEEEKAKKVKTVFENVAARYDLMNDCMSAGVHRIWKDMFVHKLRPKQRTKLIDVAGGTGDIAFRFLKYHKIRPIPLKSPIIFPNQELPKATSVPLDEVEAQYQVMDQAKSDEAASAEAEQNVRFEKSSLETDQRTVLVCDINDKMLEVGKKRAATILTPSQQSRIDWLEADAENMHSIPSDSFDVYTIAFGIRNCVHIDRVLSEAYRVLRPGGKFLCLEFSHVPNSLLRWAYDQYSFQVIPVMGQVMAGDWDSYMYLVQSIRKFPNQENFKEMIRDAGFKFVSYENLSFGIAAIHVGIKL